jgi:hypothetical protein
MEPDFSRITTHLSSTRLVLGGSSPESNFRGRPSARNRDQKQKTHFSLYAF